MYAELGYTSDAVWAERVKATERLTLEIYRIADALAMLHPEQKHINDMSHQGVRRWQVLLIGGASGTGKTSVSYRLAQYFGVGLTEIDDFQVLLEQEEIHRRLIALYAATGDRAAALSEARAHFEQARAMAVALRDRFLEARR
jgi:hypothetical protein